jgi:hypothetical protein
MVEHNALQGTVGELKLTNWQRERMHRPRHVETVRKLGGSKVSSVLNLERSFAKREAIDHQACGLHNKTEFSPGITRILGIIGPYIVS